MSPRQTFQFAQRHRLRRRDDRVYDRPLRLEYLEARRVLTSMMDWADLVDRYPYALYADETLETPGLVGSYVDASLRTVDELDWRVTQSIAGSRIDFPFLFGNDGWGARSEVGLSGGTDADWDDFSVQWDGVLDVLCDDIRLATRGDDGSRMWIDINGDGVFSATDGELVDNGWGTSHPLQVGQESPSLAAGLYDVRIQYENDTGPNRFHLADDPTVRLRPRDTFRLFVDEGLTTPGLTGSYIDHSLWAVDELDWRQTRVIDGTRIDPKIDFTDNSWGNRDEVGLTHGTDENWDYFSVQWDGYLEVFKDGTCIRTRSDDGSRMWIDANQDGVFDSEAGELTNNAWGYTHGAMNSPPSLTLPVGVYQIRVQYYDWNNDNVMQLLDVPRDMLRVAYVIPSNRIPQLHGEASLAYTVGLYQEWYRDQMERNGFGSKSFVYESYADDVTPVIHTVYVEEDDAYLREDIWGRVRSALGSAGVSTTTRGQVWFMVPEIHLQLADSSLIGGVALGGNWYGSASDPGEAMRSSAALQFMNPVSMGDDRLYDGMVMPEIGPYPFVEGVTFSWTARGTISGLSSVVTGAGLHELSHGFGLGHYFRNDSTFHGNVQGNGFRGFRNEVYPDRYPLDETRLPYAGALKLNVSTYFNGRHAGDTDDTSRPEVTMDTSGAYIPDNGLLEIAFTASDPEGLAVALLAGPTGVIGELELSGTEYSGVIGTPIYTPDATDNYKIVVYDVHGNRQEASAQITVSSGFNQAPRPFFKILPSTVMAGSEVVLDASGTSDADESAATLLVEWDLNGDGIFDTPPTTEKTYTIPSASEGNWLIRCRVTDAQGDSAISTPIALRVHEPLLDIELDGTNYAVPLESYVSQDEEATTLEIENAGATLLMAGNTWKKLAVNYDVTANTVLEFDFQSSREGEIHAIGFDNDDVPVSGDPFFQLYGSEPWWADQDFHDYDPSATNTYDAASAFSITNGNPNGVWGYGYRSTLGAEYVAYDRAQKPIFGAWTSVDGSSWNRSEGTNPSVFHNDSDADWSYSSVDLFAGELALHPGASGQYSIVRFTAPTTGSYYLDSEFAGRDRSIGTTTDVHVLVNGSSVFDESINGYLASRSFAGQVNLVSGQTVDFAVGGGSDGYVGDTTALSATLGGLQHYKIPVGEYFTGTFSHLVLANDDDAAVLGASAYSNVRIYEAPAIANLSPADGANGVALAADLEIVFDKDVQKGIGNIIIRRSSDGSVVESIDVAGGQVTIAGATVTIDLSVTLDEVTDYYVEVDAGAFADLAGNHFLGISGNTVWNFTTGDFTAPTVTDIRIGDGLTQRSVVRSMAITFSEIVAIDTGAFEIIQLGSEASVDVSFTTEEFGSITTATLTFSGDLTEHGSLVDGNYELKIRADRVRDSVGGLDLDGDEDGTAGGDHMFGDELTDNFFRFFGDADGDRDVDNRDFLKFRQSFRKAYPDPAYTWYFDFDGDGDVDNLDFIKFRSRFRRGLPH